MRYIDRLKACDEDITKKVCTFEDVADVKTPWWMPRDWIETFPKGWAPLAYVADKEMVSGIEDENLRLMPKSGSWVKYPVPGYYVLARLEMYNALQEKYLVLNPDGWRFTGWDLGKIFPT